MLKTFLVAGAAIALLIVFLAFSKTTISHTEALDDEYETSIYVPDWCSDDVMNAKRIAESTSAKVRIYPIDILDPTDNQKAFLAIIGNKDSLAKDRQQAVAKINKACETERREYFGDVRYDLLARDLALMPEGSVAVVKIDNGIIKLITRPAKSKVP